MECFLPVIDQLSTSINRLKGYEVIYDRFGFFGYLNNLSNKGLQKATKKLEAVYNDNRWVIVCWNSSFFRIYKTLF